MVGSYWVKTPIVLIPLLAQLLRGKSIILYLAAKETAGLAIFLVKRPNLVPLPPASIIATTLCDIICSFYVHKKL